MGNHKSLSPPVLLMGDWTHKQIMWNHSVKKKRNDGKGFKTYPFDEWLTFHCKGGWEVLKISRNWHSSDQDTLVIFRKLV